MDRAPKSMVIRVGTEDVGRSVRQLVQDMRQVMQPDTAARLKERRKNRLKDFTVMAGPLGVTHFMLFSRSERGNTHMRLAITPRGPTLSFRVERYSLCGDVMKSQRHPKGFDGLHLTAPLLIMNNFLSKAKEADGTNGEEAEKTQVPKHLESLVTTVFQSLFPPVSPQTMPLASIKRVLLLNREPPCDPANSAYTITLRHYAISTKSTGLTRAIKRINAAEKVHGNERRGKGVPNLGQLDDVADYLVEGDAGNYTSGSESEPDTDAEVEVVEQITRKLQHKQNAAKRKKKDADAKRDTTNGLATEKRAIKLTELGPRMRLRLLKIEEGLCDGKVMWHESIAKSKEEEEEMDQVWEGRNKEKEARRKEQRANVERKKKRKEKAEKQKNGEKVDEDEDEDMEDYEDWLDEDDDEEMHDDEE